MDMKQKILQKFNGELGLDLKSLQEIYDFHERLEIEKNKIKKSVNVRFASGYVTNGKKLSRCLWLSFRSYRWHQPLLPPK